MCVKALKDFGGNSCGIRMRRSFTAFSICCINLVGAIQALNNLIQERLQDNNLVQKLRIIGTLQFCLDILDIEVLLLRIIEVNVPNEVHNVSNVDTVAFHKLNTEIDVVKNRDNLTIVLLPCIEH